ncbi:MAG: pyridoxal-phosphate dependent enzyme [Haliscomenobacter sp.]|uniref:1-aminocyclopropane-1-carboxylate deaminase/D-cysteine desulfhydrase n=1 Tax=Haliscomenobacter sp. TaxID=2717303 RepID=UPI0029B5214A|nr:pyridoxal-phosphate dependent enzyme [Haliscomenobacter sp.]MDX2070571.1 pyridoxal-phosphate dependent enzyme [Haliscomenobacter sp.]
MQALFHHPPSPIQIFHHPILEAQNLTCFIKRDDLLQLETQAGDQAFCGNKWRKLKYNLSAAREQGYGTLLTFGGAFSNHIAATASAGKLFGFNTIGIIRGEKVEPLNPTLEFATSCEMKLHFWSREAYRRKDDPQVLAQLQEQFPQAYIIPEGGTNALALRGCAEIAEELLAQEQLDYLCLSCGTGGTLAGVIQGLAGRAFALGFSALKGDFHKVEVQQLLSLNNPNNWAVATEYHFGGYAKTPPELLDFLVEMKKYNLPLEPIYTGKMMWGVLDKAKQGYFPSGSRIGVLHTGGMQGWR